jgi:hypothetical protein
MAKNILIDNANALEMEMNWLSQVIKVRMSLKFGKTTDYTSVKDIPIPNLEKNKSILARIINYLNYGFEERIILALSLAPHIKPQVLDQFFIKNKVYERYYTEFGGLKGRFHSGFLPTAETAAFIIAGNDIKERIQLVEIFKPDHTFFKNNILKLNLNQGNEPLFSSGLELSDEYLTLFTSGQAYKPDFSMSFPAQRLTTRLAWSDLVLDPHVLSEIGEISAWIEHQKTIMDDWGLSKQLKRGYRSLFYGPPGTGKTLTACLIGKQMGLDVYRIDLSQVVSKYIGETEKNMAKIFDLAENKNWVLFFDEADALFGKRSSGGDSKDRNSNQEVAYLLQRVEDFSGVIILATNLKANMDIAFTRRFQTIIYFPAPNPDQRLQLWENSFKNLSLDEDVDLSLIANDHTMTGGSIINVLRYCSLTALRRGSHTVSMADIQEGIEKELRKAGKTM